jgi:hypothetical protein
LLEVLMGQGLIDAKRVAGLLAKEFGMAMAPDLTNFRITGDTLELVPRALAQKHRMIPVAREAGRVRLAISDPLDTDGIDAVGYLLKMPIEPVVATADEITAAIDRFYGKDANSIDDLLNDLSEDGDEAAVVTDAPEGQRRPTRRPTPRSSSWCIRSFWRRFNAARRTSTSSRSRKTFPRAVPDRRCADRSREPAEAPAALDHLAPQDHVEHLDRGKAHPAGRAHPDRAQRQATRPACFVAPDSARREHR